MCVLICSYLLFFPTLMGFRLFPDPVLPITTLLVPWLEFLLGLCLILGLLVRTAALMLFWLNILFSVAIILVILRGIELIADASVCFLISCTFPIELIWQRSEGIWFLPE